MRARIGPMAFLVGLLAALGPVFAAAPPPVPPYKRLLTGADAQRAAALLKEGRALFREGKFAEARGPAAELVRLRARLQGADHWETISARFDAEAAGRLAALPAEDRAAVLKIWKVVDQASTFLANGQLDRAQPLLEDVEKCYRKVFGEGHPDTAAACHDVALNLSEMGQYARAEALFCTALKIRRQTLGEYHPSTAKSWFQLAAALIGRGEYAQAEAHARRALEVYRWVRGEEDSTTGGAYGLVASALTAQAKYAEAEGLFRKTLAIDRKVRGEDGTGVVYGNLAMNLVLQGKLAEAEPLVRKGLDLQRKRAGDDHATTAKMLDVFGHCLNARGAYGQAEPVLRKALAIRRKALGEGHPDTAEGYNNLATVVDHLGRTAEAEALYRKALDGYRKAYGEGHPKTADGYYNLGANQKDQGKLAEAEGWFRKSLAVDRKVYGEGHPATSNSYNALAHTLQARRQYEAAEEGFRKVLAIRRKALGEAHRSTAQSYLQLGLLRSLRGDHAGAEELVRHAWDVKHKARLRASASGLERAAMGTEPLVWLATLCAHNGKPEEAWQAFEEGLARGLLDERAARNRLLTPVQRADQAALQGRLRLVTRQLLALAGAAGEPARRQRQRLEDEQTSLERQLAEGNARLEKEYGPAVGLLYDRVAIQRTLSAETALVAWLDQKAGAGASEGRGESWACVLRARGTPVWVRLPGTGVGGAWTGEDDQLAGRVRRLVSAPPGAGAADWQKPARALYAQRLAPLAKHLEGVRHLVVLLSPALRALPLEAVLAARPPGAPGFTVSYAPSGTVYAHLRELSARPGAARPPRLLALGDPAFAPTVGGKDELARRGNGFRPLPGSGREVEALRGLFRGAETLLGPDASEARLEALVADDRLKGYRYLHLATHGVADADRPMESYLALADKDLPDPLTRTLAGQPAYTGRLTAGQILATWKLDADLVTLSACQSGLGRYEGGEGYVGFAQALFLAGARSLVLSQWEVDDEATALLMVRLYQNLLGKREGLKAPLPKAEVLREAKDWLRNLSDKDVKAAVLALPRGTERPKRPLAAGPQPYAHPYYWAGFILVGDPS